MQTATAMVAINKDTTLQLKGLTPAEVVVLQEVHANRAGRGRDIVSGAAYTGESVLNTAGELNRLRHKYKSKVLDTLWPGVNKNIPQKFADIGLPVTGLAKPVEVETQPETEQPVPVVSAAPAEKPKIKKSKLA